MDIFNVLSLLGGLAMFLYGMNVMGDGLAKTAGGKLEKILEKLTSTPIRGVLLGAAVTGVIQSSSATTVMVVGLVNSGIMKLRQAVGIIMGANIGTTVTSWILSLTGIQSDNIFINMLKPSSFSPILAVIGIIFLMFTKSEKKHDIGAILLGFTVLMFGMEMMSGAVEPLKEVPEFTSILTMFSNPFLGMLVGMLVTAVIQSSSASVGILQALCATGAVSFSTAIPIIMGQNIGTCVTALISCIGTKKNAKRAAFVHLYFNIIGTFVFMVVFYTVNSFVHFQFLNDSANAAGIAVVHSVFNIAATLLLLPFSGGLEKLATLTVRDKEETENNTPVELEMLKRLDVRFLEKPAFAVGHCIEVVKYMAQLSKNSIDMALSLVDNYDETVRDKVEDLEGIIDTYEDEVGSYMVKLSSKELSHEDSQKVSIGLHVIGDLERMSDHAITIADICRKMNETGAVFSEKAKAELSVYKDAVQNIVEMTVDAYEKEDLQEASHVEPLEEAINELNSAVKKQHIKRLQKGKCTIELGISLENLINNYERVADHCSNVAVAMLQLKSDNFDTHEYLDNMKKDSNIDFQSMYTYYREMYKLK